ncbi:hypothetical protein [Listeria booriae]|uniref:hypothetical protein n=1 Tax=Listeria booriae TaxID=1552123 RepID=UPI001629CE55|nr:hypothetical protein [Listeria booriae]MBC1286898.1 hypothetical protein [Listeria booriae]MBC1306807.1 hypothetical protein [Listeria booriae]
MTTTKSILKTVSTKVLISAMTGALLFVPISPIVQASENQLEVDASDFERVAEELDMASIKSNADKLGVIDTEEEYVISDSQAVQLLKSQNIDVPADLQKSAMMRKDGVTKIVKKNGYTTVYLSASMTKAVGWGGIGAAGILTVFSGGIAMPLALAIVSAVWGVGSSFMNNGMWMKFKGTKLISKGKQ